MGVDAHALAAVVADGDRLVLDTNVLIAYLEGNQVVTDAATLLLDGNFAPVCRQGHRHQ
ncbi:MAG: hypothetical protein ACYDHD_11400 [Vulcanimicrobiaceae bacterium]